MYERKTIGSRYWKTPGDGYTMNDGREAGIRFEDVHQGAVPLAPTDLPYDQKTETAKAEKQGPGALRQIHAAFAGGDDASADSYAFAYHEAGARGRVFLDACKKAARQLNVADTIPTKGQELSQLTQAIARAHVARHLQAFGID